MRLVWRGCRIAGLLVILALLCMLIYLNRVGLPEFARRPLLEDLRARGLDFKVSRLRLRFYRGLVAEQVEFGHAAQEAGPRLTAATLDVNLDYAALLKRRVQVSTVALEHGRFAWSVSDAARPVRELAIENIRANLRLLPEDEWALDRFQADFAGARFTLIGNITHASVIRDWPWPHGTPPAGAATRRLRRFADLLEQIRFDTPPELRLIVNGDARDLQSFTARLTLAAPDAETPWGKIHGGVFTTRLSPARPGEPMHAELNLEAAAAQTPWATLAGLEMALRLVSPPGQTNLVEAGLTAIAAGVSTRWASATNAQFIASWTHALTNAIPLAGHGELMATTVVTPWASSGDFRLTASLVTRSNPPPIHSGLAWWTNLQPYRIDWACDLAEPDTDKLGARKIVCGGHWLAPELSVTNLHVEFSDGALTAQARLDVDTRAATVELESDLDVHQLSPVLPDKARRWLDRFSWQQPPLLTGRVEALLPAWTNRQPDWAAGLRSSLRLAGEVFVTNGAYLGLAADWAHTHFTYSNLIWHLPDLEAGRGDGQVWLAHVGNDANRDYYWRVLSTVDLRALHPRLEPEQREALTLLSCSQPPVIEVEVWGRAREPERLGFRGQAALTNFVFRGETADALVFSARYTNRVLEFLDPRLWRGTQTLAASGIAVDFDARQIHFTNGFSTAEPMAVARAIGPRIARDLEPYVFRQPPTVRVQGHAPLHGSSDADLTFDVDGGPFEWWKFKVPRVASRVHWRGDTLELANLALAFYGGEAAGSAHFDFTPGRGAGFSFVAGVTNASLPGLLADVSAQTNRLEGALSGWLRVTRANTEDPHSWMGEGRARLRDGFLWEIPLFGVLSKPLDAIVPGVGRSRFSEATARFDITNAAIVWEKLEMRAPTMRLQYDGLVDFDGRVDMRVEVEPLRDAWVVGRLFSLALWPVTKLFQYRITGTLDEPKSEPVYVPKFLLMPLHPFRTLSDWLTPDTNKTNAPPVFRETP